MTDEKSHDDFIKQGIVDYENTIQDWDIDIMIDHIVILSELKNKITNLILKMKQDLIDSYEEKKK